MSLASTIRNSSALRVLQNATAPLLRRMPVESWPWAAGKVQLVRVPKSIRTLPEEAPVGPANTSIIFDLLAQAVKLDGDLAECGVWEGATLVPTALYLRQHRIGKRIHGFDSFVGFDASIAKDLELGGAEDPTKRVGGFSNTSLALVQSKLRRFGVQDVVTLYDGFFKETLPRAADQTFCFVHLDCDIYESYKTTLEFFYPRMVRGGVILLDEYDDPPWPGCNLAVDEFLAGKPETLRVARSHNQLKYYLVKA
ncbi:MAG TPA: TylF/MycF/NovP-related O-methyltransferase [Thermoanaerobaculia bacterium]|nr:TylF/MycF/NovP-related O-methyltransferase [Thermoanaerobaculia bacterium]